MDSRDIFVCSIDLLFLLLVMFILGFLAVRYDANRGLGNLNYISIHQLSSIPETLAGDQSSLQFQAILIDKAKLILMVFDGNKLIKESDFAAFHDLINAIDISLPCVIYEREETIFFSKIIRALVNRNVPIGIAKIAIGEP